MSKKILVVDDEESILEVLSILLSSEGYEVVTASDGEEGLAAAKEHLPDCIILDVMMPKMSGYMVATMLSKDDSTKNIPILLLTATSQMVGSITLEMPTSHKLTKPFKPEELLSTLHTIMA